MKFLVESYRDDSVVIEGLGVLPPATEEGPSSIETDGVMFKHTRGLTPAQVTLPEGVEVTVVIESGEGE